MYHSLFQQGPLNLGTLQPFAVTHRATAVCLCACPSVRPTGVSVGGIPGSWMAVSKGFHAQTVRWDGNVWWKGFFTRELVKAELKCIPKRQICQMAPHKGTAASSVWASVSHVDQHSVIWNICTFANLKTEKKKSILLQFEFAFLLSWVRLRFRCYLCFLWATYSCLLPNFIQNCWEFFLIICKSSLYMKDITLCHWYSSLSLDLQLFYSFVFFLGGGRLPFGNFKFM